MAHPAHHPAPVPEPRVSRTDWIDVAMRVLIAEGVDAVRITRLAERMSVTRGSFYWHFTDREDLLRALRTRWEAQNTPAVEAAVAGAETLDAAVLAFFDAWLVPDRFDAPLDHAMRAWATAEPEIRAAVDAADDARIVLVAAMFARFGYSETDALIRARVLYFAQIGFYALASHAPLSERAPYLETYFECFTGRSLDGAEADAFRAKHGVDHHGPR
ncbi:MAG: TetR/AcrR family transcriptional regulator [Pseudomonadota bacterium]